MKRDYVITSEDDTSVDDIIEEMYKLGIIDTTEVLWDDLQGRPEEFLSNYLLKDHNDVCLVDKVGYLPDISDELIQKSDKSVMHLFQFEKIVVRGVKISSIKSC